MKLFSSLAVFSWRFLVLLVFGAVFSATEVRPAVAAGEPSASDVLKGRGLQRVGRTWCLPEEAELRERLVGLDRVEQRLVGAQQGVDQLIGQNEFCHRQLLQFEQIEKNSRALAAATKPGLAQRVQFEAQAKAAGAAAEQLRRQYIRPEQFGLSAPLKPALIDLVTVRTDLMIRLLPMQEAMDQLTHDYDALRHDTTVTSALRSMTQAELLGPSRSLLDGWKIVDKLRPMVFSDSLPVGREGNFYRVTALVNERQPLTFSFMGTGQQTLIPQNLAEAAGLTVDEHTPKIKQRVASGREELAWRIKVPRLRFGRNVLRDVDAFILAPEAADIGARIGVSAFAGYNVQLDADRLLLVIGGGK